MQGTMMLQPTREIVGKKSEYKTKKDFVEAVLDEQGREVEIENIGTAYMRYFPKGTENSEHEFGKGVGIYQCVNKLTKGAFEMWIV